MATKTVKLFGGPRNRATRPDIEGDRLTVLLSPKEAKRLGFANGAREEGCLAAIYIRSFRGFQFLRLEDRRKGIEMGRFSTWEGDPALAREEKRA